VLDAVIRVGRRTLRHRLLILFAVFAFVAIYFARLPFPLVIIGAGLGGVLLQRWWPEAFRPARHGHASDNQSDHPAMSAASKTPPSLRGALQLVAVFVVLWVSPFALLWSGRGWPDVFTQEMWFFTQAAFITFGGAYAVLSYIADVAVNGYQWLTAAEMVRGLGLAESTPGPLIMVTEYVGFVAAWKHAAPGLSPAVSGTLGALITVYATFLPSFFFIFIGAPFIELLSGKRRLEAALTGITAAVVGVIANLGVFFAAHVLVPDGDGIDWFGAIVAAASFGILRRFATPTYLLVPVGAVLGMTWVLITAR
jgi:chromate transporter